LLSKYIALSCHPFVKGDETVDGLYLHKIKEHHTLAQIFSLLSVYH